jgi:prepilin-type N-terminal cleavage/methylation domain-containing protein
MRKIKRLSSWKYDQGFALLEVIAGLAILSVVSIGVWSGATAVLRVISRYHDTALACARLLQLDDRFREAVGRVCVPWWLSGPTVKEMDNGYSIPFLDGQPDKVMSIRLRNGSLFITDGAYVSDFPGVTAASVSAALDASSASRGAALEIEMTGIGRVVIVARWGGTPVRRHPSL